MKKIRDLKPYTTVLPYASEIFGVYQPLLGWRSGKIKKRWADAFACDVRRARTRLCGKFRGGFEFTLTPDRSLDRIHFLKPASIQAAAPRSLQSFVMDGIATGLPPLSEYGDAVWDRVLQPKALGDVLASKVLPRCTQWYRSASERRRSVGAPHDDRLNEMLAAQLQQESAVSGFLLHLKETKQYDALKALFYKVDADVAPLEKLLTFKDPLDAFDPLKDIDRVGLSPIGVVHLFRQYFFELDTFLGPPVSHVWLSPGATVELVEVHSRRSVEERTVEEGMETRVQAERSATDQEELSDAIKTENRSDTKFGMNATVNQGWIGGSASASTSLDMNRTQSTAREVTHKRMRSQTEKLSTDIRRNFKSTFKTITEVTDTSSKRYVLANSTLELLNYELRRKMRQVGVQVQDIGTYLCWHTYVDDPGKQLGVAKLVHIAKDPEMASTPPPEAVPEPAITTTSHEITIPFVSDDDEMDKTYRDGVEFDTDFNEGNPETIQADFPAVAACDKPGYKYLDIQWDGGGNDVQPSARGLKEAQPGKIEFTVHLDVVNFHGNSPMVVKFNVRWEPTKDYRTTVAGQNQQNIAKFNEKTKHEFEKAFAEAARERIKQASKIERRKFEDLRDEERIVVYRRLIQDMLTKGIDLPDDRTRHAVAELLNTIFDIDKMLYFVAPEWWRPRLHRSHQGLGGIAMPAPLKVPAGPDAGPGGSSSVYVDHKFFDETTLVVKQAPAAPIIDEIASIDTVAWGGTGGDREDDYYITDESDPARLGSSLGWLLQLDGDDMRNAFLNAPWVKAVIPIRPGKERAAVRWLEQVHVEGGDGLGDGYVAPAEELDLIKHSGPFVTIRDAVNSLCDAVAKKHESEQKVGLFPGKDEEPSDDNRVASTPVDKVYEHGFYPLQGGFRVGVGGDFEVFDQWVEVLPTDQVVPVEVKYDPKSGRQL